MKGKKKITLGINLTNLNEFCTMNPKITRDILVFQKGEKVKEIKN